ANPPGVGGPETIGTRTALYLAMLGISLAGGASALSLRRRLAGRLPGPDATLAAIADYLAIVLVAGLLLPRVDEVLADFPAVTLWNFRVGSIGLQAILWAAIGIVFGHLAERAMDGTRGALTARR